MTDSKPIDHLAVQRRVVAAMNARKPAVIQNTAQPAPPPPPDPAVLAAQRQAEIAASWDRSRARVLAKMGR